MELSRSTLWMMAAVAAVFFVMAAMRRVRRAQIRALATGVATLRHASARAMRTRLPGPADALTGEALNLYETAGRELKNAGLSVLGDMIEERDDGSPVGTTRWFADRSGEVCGWFAAIPVKDTTRFRIVMLFFSELDSGAFVTTSRGAPELGIARPPSAHRQFVPWNDGVPAANDKHRSLMESVRTKHPGTYVRVGTLDEGVALLARQREHTNAWRRAQAADALLDADVRNVLRERFKELGPELMEQMRADAR